MSQLAKTVHFKSLVSSFADRPVVFCRSTHVRFFLPAFDPFFTSSAYLSDSKSRKSNNQRASHVPAPLSYSLAIPFNIYISIFQHFITDNTLMMQWENRHIPISQNVSCYLKFIYMMLTRSCYLGNYSARPYVYEGDLVGIAFAGSFSRGHLRFLPS